MGHSMGWAMLTTLFRGNLTLLGSFGKLSAPRLAIASEPSRETFVPMVDMLPVRGDWHKPHLRKRVAAAQKARWATIRAQEKKAA